MGSGDEDFADDAVHKAVRAANLVREAKKNPEAKILAECNEAQASTFARKEIKRKGKIVDLRQKESAKKTMRSYFQSSRGGGGGQPLAMVFDGLLPEVPGAEPPSGDEYPSSDDSGRRKSKAKLNIVSSDTNLIRGSSSGSGDTEVLSRKSPHITISSESDVVEITNLMGVDDLSDSTEDDSDFETKPSKKSDTLRSKSSSKRSQAQKRYDRHRKFQTLWAAKLPWAEGIMDADGILHMVKCKVCTVINGKPCILAPKSNTLFKHDGKRIAKKDLPQYKVKAGQQYVATQCKHRKNMKLYTARPPPTVLQQINHCTSLEARKKRVQFATLFQLLSEGRPMVEYESRVQLYKLLNVPDLPAAHWCDNSGWLMAGYMYKAVVSEMKRLIGNARYFAVLVDGVTAVDNSNYLSVHVYIVQDWVRIPLLVSLERIECTPTADNLTKLIVEAVSSGGGIDNESIAQKMLSFGADGASALQGTRAGVTLQMKEKFAPFMLGVHCVAHRCNLAFKALSSLGIFSEIEKVLTVTHAYFCKSPKRFSEFKQLAELTETKGLKMLRNVQTRWVSLIEPLRRLLSEYRTLIYKMTADLGENAKAEACLVLLLDPYPLLGMCCLLPLLEAIDTLVNFAQKRDVYICDFVAAVKVCQGLLYKMYEDDFTAFNTDEFWSFKNLLDCSHEQIHIKWVCDLNVHSDAVLTFVCHGEQIYAEHKGRPMDRDVWASLLSRVKVECTSAAKMLREELDDRFPQHHVMNAFGILYPQYWCEGGADENFDKHLRTLTDTYGHGKIIGEGEKKLLIKPLINREALIAERSLFKTCMKSNSRPAMLGPYDVNPLTRVWRVLDSNNNLTQKFGEFIKLAEMAIVHVIGSVEDERTFSTLGFLKSKLRNNLQENIQVVLGMYSQRIYSLENFPYQAIFDEWFVSGAQGRYLAST